MYSLFIVILGLSVQAMAADAPKQGALKLNKSNFIYESDPKAMATSVSVIIRTGSIRDPQGKEGLNRLAHTALTRGTVSKTREQFVDELETLGGTMDVDVGVSRTIISLKVINENLEAATKLLAEALTAPAFREEEIKRLVTEELAKLEAERANNRQLLRRAYRQALWGGTSLAFPPEGRPDSVKAITAQDLKDAWSKTFVDGNLIWAAASNQKEGKVRALLEKNFPSLPQGKRLPLPEVTPVKREGHVLYIVDRKGASTTETIIGHPGIRANDPERLTLELGMFVFGSDFTSRLPTVLRKDNGWTYGAYASYQMVDLPRSYGGYFSAYTFPQVQFTEKAVPKAVELLDEYVKKGLTKEEMDYAKNSMGNSYAFSFATAASRVTGRIYKALDGAPFPSVAEYRRQINKISLKDVQKAVQRVHNSQKLAFVVVGDAEKLKELAKLIPGITDTKVIKDPMQPL